jgi:four helix bundle protein
MPAPHERLDAWAAAHALVLAVYRASAAFPAAERYGLTGQLRRATLSIATNLAEGAAKRGRREFRRFLDIALGSLAEVTCLLQVSRDLGFLTHDAWRELETMRDQVGKRVWRLYQSMGR